MRWLAKATGLLASTEAPRFWRTTSNPYEWLLTGLYRVSAKQPPFSRTIAFCDEKRVSGGAFDIPDLLHPVAGVKEIDPDRTDPVADARALCHIIADVARTRAPTTSRPSRRGGLSS